MACSVNLTFMMLFIVVFPHVVEHQLLFFLIAQFSPVGSLHQFVVQDLTGLRGLLM